MKEFNELLKILNISRKEFAAAIGVTDGSLGVMLSTKNGDEIRPVPKWAKSALFIYSKIKH